MEAEFYAESQPPFLGSPCGLVLVSSLCKHVLAASNSEATVKRLCKLLARRNLPWVTLTLTHLLRSHVVKAAPADVAAVAPPADRLADLKAARQALKRQLAQATREVKSQDIDWWPSDMV